VDVPKTRIEMDPSLNDFYTREEERYVITEAERNYYQDFMETLSAEEKAMLETTDQFYELTFSNHGGLVMPLIVKFDFVDGTNEIVHIPAEIWKKNHETVTKVFKMDKEVKSVRLDPYQETADVNMSNNAWPAISHPSRFELFKRNMSGARGGKNEMQKKQPKKKEQEKKE